VIKGIAAACAPAIRAVSAAMLALAAARPSGTMRNAITALQTKMNMIFINDYTTEQPGWKPEMTDFPGSV
jgi:hypothetical protein